MENISEIVVLDWLQLLIENRLVNLLNVLFNILLILLWTQFILIRSLQLMNPQPQKLILGHNGNGWTEHHSLENPAYVPETESVMRVVITGPEFHQTPILQQQSSFYQLGNQNHEILFERLLFQEPSEYLAIYRVNGSFSGLLDIENRKMSREPWINGTPGAARIRAHNHHQRVRYFLEKQS